MTTKELQKEFSAEDLDLLKDEKAASGEDGDDSKSGASDNGDDAKDKGADDKKGEKVDKSDPADLFSDLDDDDDDTSYGDRKSSEKSDKSDKSKEDGEKDSDDKEDKKEDKEEKDWRESFISRALKGQEDKIPASKLERRKEALRKELLRYKSSEDYMLAGLAAREKLRSGEYRKAKLPEDATEEEVSAWRKDLGIPEKPEAYEIPKVAGHKWTEEDDPFLESFKGVAHGANYTQQQMDAAAKWYASTMAEMQDQYMQATATMDREDREQTRDALRAELGNEMFKPSLILMERLLKDDEVMTGSLGEKLMSARYQDENGQSRRLIVNPDMARLLINLARDTYGEASMISGDARTTMNSRKAEIEKIMNENITEYYQKGLDKELLEIMQKEEAGSRRRR